MKNQKEVVETVVTEPVVGSAEIDDTEKNEVKIVLPEKSKVGSVFHKILFTVFDV